MTVSSKNFQIVSGGTFRKKIPLSECERFDRLYKSVQILGSGSRQVQAQISFDDTELEILIPITHGMSIGDYDYKILGYIDEDLVVIKYGRIRVVA